MDRKDKIVSLFLFFISQAEDEKKKKIFFNKFLLNCIMKKVRFLLNEKIRFLEKKQKIA